MNFSGSHEQRLFMEINRRYFVNKSRFIDYKVIHAGNVQEVQNDAIGIMKRVRVK